jgi:pimeloyl-ACP methyl ester carboxylesterase
VGAPRYRRFCEQLASFSRLILFDKRGMGLSERVRVGTLEERMEDVRAVMDAAGSEKAALISVSEGGPMSMLFAATCPERTQALLLLGAEVKEETTDDWPWGETRRDEFEDWMQQIPGRWGKGLAAPVLLPDEPRRASAGRRCRGGAARRRSRGPRARHAAAPSSRGRAFEPS